MSEATLAEHVRTLRQSLAVVNRIVKSPRREPADTQRLKLAETNAEVALRALEKMAASHD